MWTHLDTFSGIGGFALAAAWTGRIQTVQFVEIDGWCRRVLAKHWPGVPIHDDIRTFLADTECGGCNGRERDERADAVRSERDGEHPQVIEHGRGFWSGIGTNGRLDLITGGFPCQPWSAAGKQRGTDDDRDLWPELHRLVVSLRPRWCLFENVSGLVRMEGGLDRVLTQMEASGYATGTVVVPAAAVGAYHRRDRVWVIAHANEDEGRPLDDALCGRYGAAEGAIQPRRDGALSTGSGNALAHAADGGLRRGFPSGEPGLAAQRGQDAAIAYAIGCNGRENDQGQASAERNGHPGASGGAGSETLGALGLCADGLPGRLAQARRTSAVRAPRAVQQARYREVLRRTGLQNATGNGIGEQLESRFPLAAPIAFGPDWEAGIPRTTQHEADRVNMLKALGNAIVPQVAYELLMMLLEVDDAHNG